jgi:hypothetical protein
MKRADLRELEQIPGVGEEIAEKLWGLGIHCAGDLKGKDPEELYQRLCDKSASVVDRCLLYVFRCAVYYVSNKKHRPELLKWRNWKDKKQAT